MMVYLSVITDVCPPFPTSTESEAEADMASSAVAIKSTLIVVDVRIMLNWLSTKRSRSNMKKRDLMEGKNIMIIKYLCLGR